MWAIENNSNDAVKLLLENGANQNKIDTNNNIAYTLAIQNGNQDAAELLKAHSNQRVLKFSHQNKYEDIIDFFTKNQKDSATCNFKDEDTLLDNVKSILNIIAKKILFCESER